MGLTDSVMLGGIGDAALAAGGLGASFFFTCLFTLQGVLSGTAVLAARGERYRRPDFAGAYARAVERASILPLWRGFALHMLGGWLGEANRRPARASNLKSA